MAVDSKHEKYEKFQKIWQRVNDFADGQDAVKARGETYLPKMPSHYKVDQQGRMLYDIYKQRATVWPGTTKTLRAYTGIVNRKAPSVTLPTEMNGVLDIFTIAGESLFTAASAAVQGVIKNSIYAFLVDFPDGADRPYAVKYSAIDILDWKYEISNGSRELVFVSLVEKWKGSDPVEVLHLGLIQEAEGPVYVATKYEKIENAKGKKEWVRINRVTPVMNDRTMDFIPFVPITESGNIIALDYPMLSDVVNLNLAHYQNDADYRNVLNFAGRPTPCLKGLIIPEGKSTISLGATEVLQFQDWGEWGMLGLNDDSGIEALRKASEDLKADMALAGTRALSGDPNGVEAAETANIHREGEHGQLTTVADKVSIGITAVLRIMQEWYNVPGEVSYEIAIDFNPLKINPQLLQTIWQMYVSGDISFNTMYYNLVRGELIPDTKTIQEEIDDITADRERRGVDVEMTLGGAGEISDI